MLTIKGVNGHIKHLGYELVNGRGYFYFSPIDASHRVLHSSMVMVNRLNQLTLDQWEQELKDKIEESIRVRGEEEDAAGRYPNGYDGYKNKLPFPTEEYRYVIYSFGEKVVDTTDPEVFKAERNKYPGAPMEKFRTNEEQYENKRREYNAENQRLEDLFVEDLFRHHGVENHPLRHVVYSKAYESGHYAGHSEVASHFSDLIEIIEKDKSPLLVKLIRDMWRIAGGVWSQEMNQRIRKTLADAGYPESE